MVRGGGGRRELFAATQSLGQSWSRVSHQPTLPEYPYLMGQRGGGGGGDFLRGAIKGRQRGGRVAALGSGSQAADRQVIRADDKHSTSLCGHSAQEPTRQEAARDNLRETHRATRTRGRRRGPRLAISSGKPPDRAGSRPERVRDPVGGPEVNPSVRREDSPSPRSFSHVLVSLPSRKTPFLAARVDDISDL